MKKISLVLVLILSTLVTIAQNWNNVNGRWGYQWLRSDSAQFIPSGNGTPYGTASLRGAKYKGQSALYSDTTNKKLYQFNPKDSTWTDVTAGGGSGTSCSISPTLNGLDISVQLQYLINSGCRYIIIPRGTYTIGTTVQMKDSVTIVGEGWASVIKLSKNIPAFKCGWALGGTKTTFKDFSFIGTYAADSSLQDGIFADSCNGILVDNVTASKMAGSAIRMRRTGFCCGMYTLNAPRGNIISNCYFDSCQIGVKVDTLAEFVTIANTTCTNGGIGIFTAAGSTNISSCRLGDNQYGIYMTGGSNNSHGTCINTHIPHSKQYGVYITGAGNGYRFVGNMIRQSVTAEVYMENSSIMNFEHNDIGTGAIIITNSTSVKFLDNYYWGPPVWTITGAAPSVIQNGETINTISIKDVVNSKNFDISHTNGVADFAGTGLRRIRMLNDTLNFSNSGQNHAIAGGENSGDSLQLMSTIHATKGRIKFGANSVYVESSNRWGIGTRSPSVDLHIEGTGVKEIDVKATNSSGHARMLFLNDNAGANGQLLLGGSGSPFSPNGFNVGSLLGPLALVSEANDIRFTKSQFINGSNEHARFTFDGSFLFSTTTNSPTLGRFQIHSRSVFDSLMRLNNVVAPPGSYNLLVHSLTDSGTYQIPVGSLGGAGMAIGGTITSATEGSVLFAGPSGVLAQDNANLFFKNTRLGIGEDDPQAPLHVYHASDSRIALSNTAGSDNGFAIAYTSPNMYLYNRQSGFIDFATNNTSRMKISSVGEVNIGDFTDQGAYTLQNTGGFYQSGAVKMDIGSDATGDIYYRDATPQLARLPIGTAGQALVVNAGATAPEYQTLILKGTISWTPGVVAAGSSTSTTITVTGAAVGDPVTVSKASGAYSNGEVYDAFVSAANTVTIRVHNVSTGSANYNTSETYKCVLLKY
jgi:hypothetical protein